MQPRRELSCFIIGEGTLLIRCAEILLSCGHHIHGIVSSDRAVISWSDNQNIRCLKTINDCKDLLVQCDFNYLFSVRNTQILSADIISLPKIYAINYHDALLPRYAGFNATSWAIMNNEAVHGVSWHVMVSQVDAGDVLKQQRFQVGDKDTAFTLNMECYDAAIRSFNELIDDLASGATVPLKQRLEERTYYPHYKQPYSACLFSWNRSARDLEALVRALSFGPYPNELGLPKIAIGGEFVVVLDAESRGATSECSPGTITDISTSTLTVTTGYGEICLHKFLTIDGQPLSVPSLAKRYGLHQGYCFGFVDQQTDSRIASLYRRICKHEVFWVKQLEEACPIRLSYRRRDHVRAQTVRYERFSQPVPNEVERLLHKYHNEWPI